MDLARWTGRHIRGKKNGMLVNFQNETHDFDILNIF